MGFDVINIGATANDGTGDPLRTAFDKTNDNFALAVEGPTGAVTADTVALFDGTTGKLIKGGGQVNADIVVTSDARLSDARTPLAHGNEAHTSTFVDAAGAAAAAPVQSVNTQTGVVVLAAADVGADASGTASSAVSSHAAVTTSVHGIADTASLVVGPATATSGRVAVYDGTTGKLLQDGTKAEADLVVGPANAVAGRNAVFGDTTGKALAQGPQVLASNSYEVPLVAGRYLNPFKATISGAASANNVLIISYFPVSRPITVERVAMRVTVLEVGTTARIGFFEYAGGGNNVMNLLLDVGQIDCSTTGDKEITLASPFTITDAIWVGHVVQNSVGTVRLNRYNAPLFPIGAANLGANTAEQQQSFFVTGVSGALASSYNMNFALSLPYQYAMRIGSLL
jgi:hypothetical protein